MKKYLYILPMLGMLLTAALLRQRRSQRFAASVTTLDASEITRSTAVLNGETGGAVGNMLTRGVCFSTSETVDFEDSKVSVLRGSGPLLGENPRAHARDDLLHARLRRDEGRHGAVRRDEALHDERLPLPTLEMAPNPPTSVRGSSR